MGWEKEQACCFNLLGSSHGLAPLKLEDPSRKLLALGILVPFSAFVVFVWVVGGDLAGKLTVSYLLGLAAVPFLAVLQRENLMVIRSLSNVVGAVLTLLSITLPYAVIGGYSDFVITQGSVSWFAPQLIVVGGILTLLSRYGAIVTTAGLWRFASIPISGLAGFSYSFGAGYWLAWFGVAISLMGRSLNIPFLAQGSGNSATAVGLVQG